MTVLITGGAGYIGSITTRLIRASGRGVVVLDTLENGHLKAVGDAPFVQGDIADSDLVARVVAEHQVDEVVHFAAYKAVGESMLNPGKYFSNNVTGSQKLFESLHTAGVTRVVFSSTAAVYGTPQSVPVRETDVLSCESVYAETKLMIEKTLGWYSQTTSMRNVCLRYFNAAGASEEPSTDCVFMSCTLWLPPPGRYGNTATQSHVLRLSLSCACVPALCISGSTLCMS
jgi:UDP-glucose 4-epimerase